MNHYFQMGKMQNKENKKILKGIESAMDKAIKTYEFSLGVN